MLPRMALLPWEVSSLHQVMGFIVWNNRCVVTVLVLPKCQSPRNAFAESSANIICRERDLKSFADFKVRCSEVSVPYIWAKGHCPLEDIHTCGFQGELLWLTMTWKLPSIIGILMTIISSKQIKSSHSWRIFFLACWSCRAKQSRLASLLSTLSRWHKAPQNGTIFTGTKMFQKMLVLFNILVNSLQAIKEYKKKCSV